MSAYFADTAFYLALLNRRDSLHQEALDLARSLDRPIVTTAWILTEVANWTAPPPMRQRFLQLLDALASDPSVLIVEHDEALYQRGLALYRSRTDKAWSLTDCVSFIVMQERNLHQALTADHHFEQAGFAALLR